MDSTPSMLTSPALMPGGRGRDVFLRREWEKPEVVRRLSFVCVLRPQSRPLSCFCWLGSTKPKKEDFYMNLLHIAFRPRFLAEFFAVSTAVGRNK
jgi:hypothetical protein